MKKMTGITIIQIAILSILMTFPQYGQVLNPQAVNEQTPDYLQFSTGYDFGVITHLSYYRLLGAGMPVILGADISIPMGSTIADDFKVLLGGQMELFESENFAVTLSLRAVVRRHQTDLVRIVNIGSDIGASAGYFTSAWHAAGEIGFDKSINSHLRHSETMKRHFPAIRDGWYFATGGHWYFGVQGGIRLAETVDLSLRIGGTNAEGNDENAMLPVYLQFGIGLGI